MNDTKRTSIQQGAPTPRGGSSMRSPGGPVGGPGGHRMAFEKPKDAWKVALRLLGYLGARKVALLAVIILILLSSASMLAGSYA
jgi:hypothetical protein